MRLKETLGTGAIALCSFLASCTPGQPKDQFTLKGSINGGEKELIYLAYMQNDSMIKDSVKIEGGQFEFKGKLPEPAVSASVFMGDMQDYQNMKRCGIFLEPKTMTISIDIDNFDKVQITGSLSQAEMDSVSNAVNTIMEEAKAIREALQTCTDNEMHAQLMDSLEPYNSRATEVQLNFVKTHSNSYVTPYYMRFLMGNMTYPEIKQIYDNMSEAVKQYSETKEIEQELAVLERVLPGKPAPYFRALSHKGDSISVADLKGKVVLLDFWATWCVPCRKSFPHVKSLYEKYHAKGLEVFCVADNDGQDEAWKKAIEQDGVQMFYHVLRGMKWDKSKGADGMDHTNDISDLYAIHYLPTKYLIDREGNMIGKFNDEELDAQLKNIFGE